MPEASPEQRRTPRPSLTKKHLEQAVAIDLLQLLQTVTADGRLLPDEIKVLGAWLRDRRQEDLPAIAHLSGIVERVLADGRVSDEERAFVQKTVESILPTSERAEAVMRR